jgi:hypothetical protein
MAFSRVPASQKCTKMHNAVVIGFLNTWKTPDDVASSGAQSVHKIAQSGRNIRQPGTRIPRRR